MESFSKKGALLLVLLVGNAICMRRRLYSAAWLEWSPVSCSVSCGKGTAYRFRNCSTGVAADCSGNRFAFQVCDRGTCGGTITTEPRTTVRAPVGQASWSSWSTSISCSATCGSGYGERVRVCSTGHNPDCQGLAFDVHTCKDLPVCEADGVWGSWGSWGACSVTCGTGRQMSSRTCTYQAGRLKGKDCVGSSTQFRSCLQGSCPVDGVWTSWGVWSDCSQTCNRGVKFRLRNCSYPDGAVRGKVCPLYGHGAETALCNMGDGQWSQWTSYTSCTVTCGHGTRFRARTCVYPTHLPHGTPCAGNSADSSDCNTQPCSSATTRPTSTRPTTVKTTSATPTVSTGKLVTQTSASTIPMVCNVCNGNSSTCETSYHEETCQGPGGMYCINNLQNLKDGSRRVRKKCGTYRECYDEWYMRSSHVEVCLRFDQSHSFALSVNFNCTYCCTTPGCNKRIETVDRFYV